MGKAHIAGRVDWAKLTPWISWTFHPDACRLRDVAVKKPELVCKVRIDLILYFGAPCSNHDGRRDEGNHSKKVRMRYELTCVRNGCNRLNGQAVCRVCWLLLASGSDLRSRELDSDFPTWAITERMERLIGI